MRSLPTNIPQVITQETPYRKKMKLLMKSCDYLAVRSEQLRMGRNKDLVAHPTGSGSRGDESIHDAAELVLMARPHVSKSWCVGQTTTVCKSLSCILHGRHERTRKWIIPDEWFCASHEDLILVSYLLNVGEWRLRMSWFRVLNADSAVLCAG